MYFHFQTLPPVGKHHHSALLGGASTTDLSVFKPAQKHGTRHRRKRTSLGGNPMEITMNDRNNNNNNIINGPELELKLSPPRDVGPTSPGSESPRSSCVSSEGDPESGEAVAMVVVGCQRCMMYAMVAEEGGRCPRCKTSILLTIVKDSPVRMVVEKRAKLEH